MHEFPAASVHVGRHLTARERATIAGALEHFATSLPIERQLEVMAAYDDEPLPLAPDVAVALARELVDARKVKVCRSKQKPA